MKDTLVMINLCKILILLCRKHQLLRILTVTVFLLYNSSTKASVENIFPPPINDDCSGAVTLTVSPDQSCTAFETAVFTQATVSAQGTNCTALNGGDIWYEFTATSNAHTIALSDFTGTPQPVIIVLYEGNCTALTQLYCSNNNVINASSLTIGELYKIKVYFNFVNPTLSNTFTICVTTPPPPANNNQTDCLITTINYDFETPAMPNTTHPFFLDHDAVQGWRTTATDEKIEFWPYPNFQNHPSYSGNQFIELNANQVSGVYQDYSTPQPTEFTYGFAHKGRNGTDTCQLKAGPPGGPYVNVGPPVSTGNIAWSYNTGTYIVPAGQTVTRFIFQSVSSVGGPTIGNFLDAVSFTANNGILSENPVLIDCNAVEIDVLAAGVGTWTAHTDNPTTTTIADSSANNTQISGFGISGIYRYDWTTPYCISTLEVQVIGVELMEAEVTVNNGQVCSGENAEFVFTGFPDTQVTFTLNGGAEQTIILDESGIAIFVVEDITANQVVELISIAMLTSPFCESQLNGTASIEPLFTDASFFMTTNCSGAIATVTGTEGGTFSFNPIPQDGALLDPVTGEITNGTPGNTYTVEYTIETPCLDSSSQSVTLYPQVTFNTPEPLIVCDDNRDGYYKAFDLNIIAEQVKGSSIGLLVTFYEDENEAYEGLAENQLSSPFANTISSVQTIWIRVTDENTGCFVVTQTELLVYKCFIPKGISPNNDGKNDSFDLSEFRVQKLTIFNRYGVEVYSFANYTNQWEGQSNRGSLLPDGTYYYHFVTPTGIETGYVQLVREVK